MIGSGRSIRRDFTPGESLAGGEVFLALLAAVAVRWNGTEFNVNPPGTLAGLGAVADLCAFIATGVIVTSLSAEIGGFR